MSAIDLVARLRAARRETQQRYAMVDRAALQEERTWRGRPTTLVHRLQWPAEGDEARAIHVIETRNRLGAPPTTAQSILAVGGAARGRLRGTLIGVPDALFDQPPAPGEWSLRHVLGQVIATDTRYRIAVEYAIDRVRSGRGGPLRPPDTALPQRTGEAESIGSRDELLARLDATRDALVASLATIPDELLSAPTNWFTWDLDVRFRLHRFAAHDREHTIQLRAALQALSFVPSEAQLILADAEAVRGTLEALILGTPAALLEQSPPGGGTSIAAIAEESIADEPV